MDEGLRTIQLSRNWIGVVQVGCRTLVGLVLRNEGYIHSESLISTPLNLTLNRLLFQPNSDMDRLGQSRQALLQMDILTQIIYMGCLILNDSLWCR